MSKQKLLTMAVLGLLVLNLGLIGFLFLKKPLLPPGGGPPPGPRQLIIDKLDFNPQQVDRYEKLIENHKESVNVLHEEIKTTKNVLYQTLTEEASPAKDSLINRLAELQKEMEIVHYTHFEAIRNNCTPDQLGNYQELTSELARYFAPGKNPPPRPKD